MYVYGMTINTNTQYNVFFYFNLFIFNQFIIGTFENGE